jgi:hypothetical protein
MYYGYPQPGWLENEEGILLSKRKGFIRLALKYGVDLVPVFVFGAYVILYFLTYFVKCVIIYYLFFCSSQIYSHIPLPQWGKVFILLCSMICFMLFSLFNYFLCSERIVYCYEDFFYFVQGFGWSTFSYSKFRTVVVCFGRSYPNFRIFSNFLKSSDSFG